MLTSLNLLTSAKLFVQIFLFIMSKLLLLITLTNFFFLDLPPVFNNINTLQYFFQKYFWRDNTFFIYCLFWCSCFFFFLLKHSQNLHLPTGPRSVPDLEASVGCDPSNTKPGFTLFSPAFSSVFGEGRSLLWGFCIFTNFWCEFSDI